MIDIVDKLAKMPIAEWEAARVEILRLRALLEEKDQVPKAEVDANTLALETSFKKSVDDLTSKLEATEGALLSKNKALESLDLKVGALEKELASQYKLQEESKESINFLTGRLNVMTAQCKSETERAELLKRNLEEMTPLMETATEKISSLTTELDRIKVDRDFIVKQLEVAETKNIVVKNEAPSVLSKVTSIFKRG